MAISTIRWQVVWTMRHWAKRVRCRIQETFHASIAGRRSDWPVPLFLAIMRLSVITLCIEASDLGADPAEPVTGAFL